MGDLRSVVPICVRLKGEELEAIKLGLDALVRAVSDLEVRFSELCSHNEVVSELEGLRGMVRDWGRSADGLGWIMQIKLIAKRLIDSGDSDSCLAGHQILSVIDRNMSSLEQLRRYLRSLGD